MTARALTWASHSQVMEFVVTAKVAVALVKLCKGAGDWQALKDTIILLAKRRQQHKKVCVCVVSGSQLYQWLSGSCAVFNCLVLFYYIRWLLPTSPRPSPTLTTRPTRLLIYKPYSQYARARYYLRTPHTHTHTHTHTEFDYDIAI